MDVLSSKNDLSAAMEQLERENDRSPREREMGMYGGEGSRPPPVHDLSLAMEQLESENLGLEKQENSRSPREREIGTYT